jgi:ribosomal protein L11 methyltransferase
MNPPANVDQSNDLSGDPSDLPDWLYATPGPLRERLCGLSLAGVKTATFDVVDPTEPPPSAGSRWVMRGSDGSALAVLEVTECIEMRFAQVPWELASAEGESFVDLADWRSAHEAFWNGVGVPVDDDTMVRCERFRLMHRLPGADGPRFPTVEVLVPEADVEWASAELAEYDIVGIEEIRNGEIRSGETLNIQTRNAETVSTTTNGTPIGEGHVLLRVGCPSDAHAAELEQQLSKPWWRRFEVLIGDDWLDSWRDDFQPIEVGPILVWPAWFGDPPALTSPRIAIPFEPGRAWGTGAHQSTQLALRLLLRLDLRGAKVFDAGCGSGLLSVAAAKLGANEVLGCDIDMTAPAIAHANAERAGVRDRVTATTQSIRELTESTSGRWDVVVANILAPVLIDHADDLQQLVALNGHIVLAGLIDEQLERVSNAYLPFRVITTLADGTWQGLLLQG